MSSKTVNVITNISNGAGLQKDAELFSALLEKFGHKTRLLAYDRPHTGISYPADINVFMEVMPKELMHNSSENWFMPNSEWYDIRNIDPLIPSVSKILCKTKDCLRIWESKVPNRCVYTGFEAEDLWDNAPPASRQNNFFHLAGNSGTKNTQAIINAWKQFRLPYNLEVVIRDLSYVPLCVGVPNVEHHQRLAQEYVRMAFNLRWFHLMPSQYEGYGHSLHEALGCGQLVITTNAAPMNQFNGVVKNLLIPSFQTYQRELATMHVVSPEDIASVVEKAANMSLEDRISLSHIARQEFLKDRESFREKIRELFQ